MIFLAEETSLLAFADEAAAVKYTKASPVLVLFCSQQRKKQKHTYKEARSSLSVLCF